MMSVQVALKTDENLPQSAAATLISLGFDAISVFDQGLRGAPDARIAEVCRQESRVLVTLDLDFSDIRAYPPDTTAGIIVLRVGSQDARNIDACLRRIAPLFRSEHVRQRLWIVDETTVRIREG
jgi:predicted nuclease of predicted toxin-antitoxin system